MRMKRHFAVCLLAAVNCSIAAAADPVKPPPPGVEPPGLGASKAVVLCVDCDEPFGTTGHKNVLEGLASSKYVSELRKGLYVQDSIHQFESRAHFDNCDFDASVKYIDSLYAEVETHVKTANEAKAKGDVAKVDAGVRVAFYTLGQSLHGVQDFYAHTNYVELSKGGAKKVTDIDIVAPWREEGKAKIAELRKKGLVSGYVFWGLPQRCDSGAVSHANLAKDSESTPSGKLRVPHLDNISQYRIALFLAREASLELMRDAYKRWPLLKEVNGPNVAFEVLLDRRGL